MICSVKLMEFCKLFCSSMSAFVFELISLFCFPDKENAFLNNSYFFLLNSIELYKYIYIIVKKINEIYTIKRL